MQARTSYNSKAKPISQNRKLKIPNFSKIPRQTKTESEDGKILFKFDSMFALKFAFVFSISLDYFFVVSPSVFGLSSVA